MINRKKLLWLILLLQSLVWVVYFLVLLGNDGGIDTAIGFITGSALNLLPNAASSSVLAASDWALAYWWLVLSVAFVLSILLALVMALTERNAPLIWRVIWTISFLFLGFIAVPAYCIIKLAAKRIPSAA